MKRPVYVFEMLKSGPSLRDVNFVKVYENETN